MSEKIAAIIGATGMIGTYLCDEILNDDYFATARLIVRRPLPKTNPGMEVKLVDFNDAESLKLALEDADTIFCCIGTTQKNVKGDNELYRKIDFEIPVRAARFGKEAGCEKFILVSAVGANAKSRTFYLKLKGELENAIQSLSIETVHVMQPSMLLGDRNEKRNGEKLLQGTMKMISGLFSGSMRKFRAVHGRTVAKAMLNAAKKERTGFFRHTFDDIERLAGIKTGKSSAVK
jgi:uncharacterized protein YbjT (DUF2867 family)